MIKYDADSEKSKEVVAAALKDGQPRLVIAKGQEAAVLIKYSSKLEKLIAAHPRRLHGDLKDARDNWVSIAMGSLQIFLKKEQDAMVYVDEKGQPKMALVGINRYRAFDAGEAG